MVTMTVDFLSNKAHPLPLALFVDFSGQPCLVVGGGPVAVRKATTLLKAGAKLTVVALKCSPAMHELVVSQQVTYFERRYLAEDLSGQRLIVVATDDAGLNASIASAAKQQDLLVDVANPGHLSNAVIPTVIDRAPLQIALFSGGASPALVRQLNRQLEAFIPHSYGRLAAFARSLRHRVKTDLLETSQRRRFWRHLLSGPVAEHLLSGGEAGARELAEQHIAQQGALVGTVMLVGAGPGDPELLTVRALRQLQQVDVVVHDRLVGPGVLALIPEDVERIDVGKAPGHHSHHQDEINQILIEQAKQGKRVMRLKGGDSFVFGRGGEEIEALVTAGITCQIVPGITAAIACASLAGIPLTHRDLSHGCIFLPGQHCDNASVNDWSGYAQAKQTLVFYMAVNNLQKICRQLLNCGMSADMPVALVQQATLPQQRVSIATLGAWSQPHSLQIEPGILIIGETVRLSAFFNPTSRVEE